MFKTFCFDVVEVSGNSMFDTLEEGDILIVSCQPESIERNDIVIAKVGQFKVIKRVVGLPQETIQIVDGKVYVDGILLAEDWCEETEFAGVAEEPYLLADGEYFLLGDNRSGSEDSRVYGGVSFENIRGVVIHRIYPFGSSGEMSHGANGDE